MPTAPYNPRRRDEEDDADVPMPDGVDEIEVDVGEPAAPAPRTVLQRPQTPDAFGPAGIPDGPNLQTRRAVTKAVTGQRMEPRDYRNIAQRQGVEAFTPSTGQQGMDAPDLQVRSAAIKAQLGAPMSNREIDRVNTRQRLEAQQGNLPPERSVSTLLAGSRLDPRGTRAEQAAEAKRKAAEEKQAARTAEIQARRDFNSKALADYKAKGIRYYTDPADGRIRPVVDEKNRVLHFRSDWEDGEDPQGRPAQVMRDEFGQRQFRKPTTVESPDVKDDFIYAKMKDGTYLPYMPLEEAAQSPDFYLKKQALGAIKKRNAEIAKERARPLLDAEKEAELAVSSAQAALAELESRSQALMGDAAKIDDKTLRATEGGVPILGWGAKPTADALREQENKAGIDAQNAALEAERTQLLQDLDPSRGRLKLAVTIAKNNVALEAAKIARDAHLDQRREILARLEFQGKEPGSDPQYLDNERSIQAAEAKIKTAETYRAITDRAAAQASAKAAVVPAAQPETPSTVAEGVKSFARGALSEGFYAAAEGGARMVQSVEAALKEERGGPQAALSALIKERDALSGGQPTLSGAKRGRRTSPEEAERLKQLEQVEIPAARAAVMQDKQRRLEGTAGGWYADQVAQTRDIIRKALPVDQKFAESTLGQIAQGAGQLAGTLPLAFTGAAGPAALATASFGQIYQEGYDDAIASGADPARAHQAALQYLPAGALDALSNRTMVGKALKPLIGKATVRQIATDVLKTAAMEGATEGTQQGYLNAVAKVLEGYDPEREFDEEVLQSIVVGAVLGGGITAVSQGAQRALQRDEGTLPPPEDTGRPSTDVPPPTPRPITAADAVPAQPTPDEANARLQAEAANDPELAALLAESEPVATAPVEAPAGESAPAAEVAPAAVEPVAAPVADEAAQVPEPTVTPEPATPVAETEPAVVAAEATPTPSPEPPVATTEITPEAEGAGAPAQQPTPTQAEDYARYQAIQREWADLRKRGVAPGSEEIRRLWAENEEIKNRYGGMPPEAPQAEAKTPTQVAQDKAAEWADQYFTSRGRTPSPEAYRNIYDAALGRFLAGEAPSADPTPPTPRENPPDTPVATEQSGPGGGQNPKEPWQMTRREYALRQRMIENPERKPVAPELEADVERLWGVTHEDVVAKAIREGKDVPAEVLAQYPGIKESPAAQDFDAEETKSGTTYQYRLAKEDGKWTAQIRIKGGSELWEGGVGVGKHPTRKAAAEKFAARFPEAALNSQDSEIRGIAEATKAQSDQKAAIKAKQKAEAAETNRVAEEKRAAYMAEVRAVPLKGKSQQITLNRVEDGKEIGVPTQAMVYGDWAIHKVTIGKNSFYSVTHVPSGKRAQQKDTLAQAKEMVQAFIHAGIDVSKADLGTDKATLKRLAEVAIAVNTNQTPSWFGKEEGGAQPAVAPTEPPPMPTPAQMKAPALRAELAAAGVQSVSGVPLEDANAAQLMAAVGKLRRGQLISDEKPAGATAPSPASGEQATPEAPAQKVPTKAESISKLLGPRPPEGYQNYEKRTRWDTTAKQFRNNFSAEELAEKASEKAKADEKFARESALTSELYPELNAAAEAAGSGWRTALKARAEKEGISNFNPPTTSTRGETAANLARRIAELRIKNEASNEKAVADVPRGDGAPPEGQVDRPPPTQPLAADKILKRLQETKKRKLDEQQGKAFAATEGLYRAAEVAALDIAILAVRAGRPIEQAVRMAIARFKARYPAATPQELSQAEASIRGAINEPPPPPKAPAPKDGDKRTSRVGPSMRKRGVPIEDMEYDARAQDERMKEAQAIVTKDGPEKAEAAIENPDIAPDTRVAIGGTLVRDKMLDIANAKPEEVAALTRDMNRIVRKMRPELATKAGQTVAMWGGIYRDISVASGIEYLRNAQKKMDDALGGKDAQEAIDGATAALDKDMTAAEIEAEIERLKKKYTTKPARKVLTALQKQVERVQKLRKLGALQREDLADLVGKELKIPTPSPEQMKRIAEIADRIKNAPTHAERSRAELDLADQLAVYKGVAAMDVLSSMLTAGVLSGYTTQLASLQGTALNMLFNIGTVAATNPSRLKPIIEGLVRGVPLGADQFKAIWKTGVGTRDLQDKTGGAGSPLSRVDFERDFGIQGAAGKAATVSARISERVFRFMRAVDASFYYPAREAYATLAATKLLEGEYKGAELAEKVRATLQVTPEAFLRARQQAASEGYTGVDLGRRVADIIEAKRQESPAGLQAVKESEQFAAESTFTNEPVGLAGVAYRAMRNLVENAKVAGVPILKPWLMFLKTPANVFNAVTNYTPAGFVRSQFGMMGTSPGKENRRNFTADERAQLNIKAAIGTTLMSTLLIGLMDDEDIEISGKGPQDAGKRRQMQDRGWIPYSVRMGDKYVSYKDSPLLLPLAIVGNARDSVKYQKPKSDLVLGNQYADAMLKSGTTIFDLSMLTGLGDLLSAMRNSDMKGVSRTLASVPANTVIPLNRLLQQIDQTFDEQSYEVNPLVGSIPFARRTGTPRTDVLGRPTTYTPTKRFVSSEREGVLDTVLREKGLFVSEPSKETKVGNRVMTEDEYRKYRQISGQRIRVRLESIVPRLKVMTKEAADKEIDRIEREERERAKRAVVIGMPAPKR